MDWLPFVGILVALVSVGIALAGLILVTTQRTRTDMRADMKALEERLNKRIDEGLKTLSERLGRQEQEQARMSERLGRLEQEQARMSERLGRLEQEQARMNGVLETIRDGLSYRVERADAGERVAEDAESYEAEG